MRTRFRWFDHGSRVVIFVVVSFEDVAERCLDIVIAPGERERREFDESWRETSGDILNQGLLFLGEVELFDGIFGSQQDSDYPRT